MLGKSGDMISKSIVANSTKNTMINSNLKLSLMLSIIKYWYLFLGYKAMIFEEFIRIGEVMGLNGDSSRDFLATTGW